MQLRYLIVLTALAVICTAQTMPNLKDHEPVEPYDNIYVEKLAGDSNQTAFLIWIKKEVPKHMHAWHTENIHILAGKGEMTLNDEKFIIQKGDYFNIPPNTPHALKVHSSTPVKVLSIQSPHFDGSDRILIQEP